MPHLPRGNPSGQLAHRFEERARGAGLIAMVIPVALLVVLGSALASLSATSLRSSVRSQESMRAYYVADTGAHIGNALVRAQGSSTQATSFTESIAGGTAAVDIIALTSESYRVTSQGTYRNETRTVEMVVLIRTSGLTFQSGLQVDVSPSVAVTGDVDIEMGTLDSNAGVSGYDHDASGNLLADQTNAVPGVGIHGLPGGYGISANLESNSFITGDPTTTTEGTTSQSSSLQELRDWTLANADTFVTGGVELSENYGGYGTSTDPALVYANVGTQDFRLVSNFTGYGTLFIDLTRGGRLFMDSNATWFGPVVIRFSGDQDLDPTRPLISMNSNTRIIGGISLLLDHDGTFQDGDHFLSLDSNATIRYSSQLVGNTLDQTISGSGLTEPTSKVTSIRLQ